jgi:hypothetical protein
METTYIPGPTRLNTCSFHKDDDPAMGVIKIQVKPGRFTFRCAACDDEMAAQAGEIAAELAYERHLEDAGWRDAAFDREMEARMF